MEKCGKKLIVLAVAWILWEHVMVQGGPDRWRSMGSIPSQEICIQNSQRMAQEAETWHARNAPSGVYLGPKTSNYSGFELIGNTGRQRYIFECYPSDFDPRPRG
jgi:hypothetical protein